ncbi:hypothetical protein ACVRTF_004224 [Cronobacter turicensis]
MALAVNLKRKKFKESTKNNNFKSNAYTARAFKRAVIRYCRDKHIEVTDSEAAALACMIDSFRVGRYTHDQDDSLSLISWEFKQKAFGSAKRFDDINAVAGFFVCRIRHSQHSKRAAGWALTEAANSLADSFFATVTDEELSTGGLDTSSGIRYRVQSKAVSSTAFSKRELLKGLLEIHNAVKVDIESLSLLCDSAVAWEKNTPCPKGGEWLFSYWQSIENSRNEKIRGKENALNHVRLAANQARQIMIIARASPIELSFPIRYDTVSTGRLYESSAGVTLQGCCREVKRAALKGSWDIDISNCHWSLLQQMANRCGVPTPAINNYLGNKKAVRQELAMESGTDVDGAKTILIALIYGARLTQNMSERHSELAEKIGAEAAGLASKSSVVKGLKADLNAARKAVISYYEERSTKTGHLLNDVGKQIASSKVDKLKLAHILQGAEVMALIAMTSVLKDSVSLLQHDGLTVRDKPNGETVRLVEEAIKEQTGFSLSVEIEEL